MLWFPTPPEKGYVPQMLNTLKGCEANISLEFLSFHFLFTTKLDFIFHPDSAIDNSSGI